MNRKAQRLADKLGQTFVRIDGELLEFRRGYAEPSVRRLVGRPVTGRGTDGERLEIRMTTEDRAAIDAHAIAAGMTPQKLAYAKLKRAGLFKPLSPLMAAVKRYVKPKATPTKAVKRKATKLGS